MRTENNKEHTDDSLKVELNCWVLLLRSGSRGGLCLCLSLLGLQSKVSKIGDTWQVRTLVVAAVALFCCLKDWRSFSNNSSSCFLTAASSAALSLSRKGSPLLKTLTWPGRKRGKVRATARYIFAVDYWWCGREMSKMKFAGSLCGDPLLCGFVTGLSSGRSHFMELPNSTLSRARLVLRTSKQIASFWFGTSFKSSWV